MQRRTYLAGVVGVVASTAAGCLDDSRAPGTGPATSEGGADPDATTTTPSTPTAPSTPATSPVDPADDIAIGILNGRPEAVSVHLRLRSASETVLETTVTVDGEDEAVIESGIEEVGSYELRVDVAGDGEDTFPFSIDGYALRSGSDVIVEVRDDRVNTMIEE